MFKRFTQWIKIRLPSAMRNLTRMLKNIKLSPEFIKETCLVAGFLMLLRGLWLIWPPAMWIIGGVCLMWFGLPGKRVGNK